MDGLSHQRRLDERPALECARQRLTLEARDSRPESHVRRGRVLRLQAPGTLDRARQRQPAPLEQELPGQERAVQLAAGQDALGHIGTLTRG